MMSMNKAQAGKKVAKKPVKKRTPHPNDDYKDMVDPATGKKGTMGGEGTTPPFTRKERSKMPRVGSMGSGKNGKTIKKAKSGTTINKAQNGRKLKLSEKYSKTADSLSNEDLRKMTAAGKMTVNRKEPRWKQKTDSLIKSADKDFKGSLEARKKSYELRKKGMKTGGSVKKCKYGCK